jgi:superfamily II DNA/RNA helicase
VESPTGTGKTLAFLLPNISNIDIDNQALQYIVFVPTRELGKQIHNVMKELKEYLPFTSMQALGGDDHKRQADKLSRAQVIVATPNRFERLINENKINLQSVKYITVDEIDMILGFDMMYVIEELAEKRFQNNIT